MSEGLLPEQEGCRFSVICMTADGRRHRVMRELHGHVADRLAATLGELMPDAEFTVAPDRAFDK